MARAAAAESFLGAAMGSDGSEKERELFAGSGRMPSFESNVAVAGSTLSRRPSDGGRRLWLPAKEVGSAIPSSGEGTEERARGSAVASANGGGFTLMVVATEDRVPTVASAISIHLRIFRRYCGILRTRD